jgi:hypothetical protein
MFRFSLAVWRRGASEGIARIAFGLTSIDDARAEIVTGPVPLTSDYLAAVSPRRRTIPEVRTPDEAALYAKLHSAFPALEEISAEDAWRVSFRREFDMTNDARHFVTPERAAATGGTPEPDGTWEHPDLGTLLPLYEGRMVHQFDAAAKGHVGGHGRSARWRVLGPNEKQVRPRYLVPSRIADQRGITREPRAAFCDITGHANERTVLAALIPANAVCGNKVPTCAFDPGDPDVALVWLALANSLVIDWIARRRVSTTLNFFHWNELPLPRLDPHAPTGRKLVDASRALSATPGRPWELGLDTRADLRAGIDAAVAQLYGVSVREMALIMQDFPLLDRSVGPDQHRTVTRDLVLARLAAAYGEPTTDVRTLGFYVARGEPTTLAERVDWHLAAGAIGYIPGEHAHAVAKPA